MSKKIFFFHIFLFCLLIFGLQQGCKIRKDNKSADEVTNNTVISEVESSESVLTDSLLEMSEEESSDSIYDNHENKKTDDFIRLMPNVTSDMLSVDYWMKLTDSPDAEIMSLEEIQEYNMSCLPENAERKKFLNFSEEDSSRTISEEQLTAYLDEAETYSDAFFSNGNSVPSTYWDKVKENVNYDAIEAENVLTYGFAVKRGEIRQFPAEEVITTDHGSPLFDEMQISTFLTGEPIIVALSSKDKKWCFVLTQACCGWTKKTNVAVLNSYNEWNIERNPSDYLIVTGDEITIEYDNADSDVSEVNFTMGCKLTLVPWEECTTSKEGREPYGNYVTKIPCRDNNGNLIWKYAYVPYSRDVHIGYLKYTRRNLLETALKCLGNRYGWGGMYHARDCSQYIMEIYRCFGFILPRNSTGLSELKTETIYIENMDEKQKETALDSVPVGSILYLKGHVMLYLGKVDNHYYVISASASVIPDGSEEERSVHSVVINDLHAKRRNGSTWLEALEKYKIIRN